MIGRADQQHVGLLLHEPQRRELLDEAPVQRRLRFEVELLERLVRGEARESEPAVEPALLGRGDLDGEQIVQKLGV